MLREEFRLHAELFGRGRFVAFPLFTILLVAGGVWLLELTGTSIAEIVAGLHALVFFFGLQVGTIGLVGRDAMRDVLGDLTLLVFSARTLPVSRQRLLGIFILKDVVYYVIFFLTPVVLGFLPMALAGGLSAVEIGLLWVTIAGTFALGTTTSLTLAGIGTRSKLALLGTVFVAVALSITYPAIVVELSPYGVYSDPALDRIVGASVLLGILLLAGLLLFDPSNESTLRRGNADRYQQLSRFGGGLTARPILEVSRSSGSLWKVAFSLGVLFAVTALLLDRLAVATALDPSGGIAFGALLGLGTFTTYNWVTQFDAKREYLRYPVNMRAVIHGKLRAFLVLSIPVGLVYLAVGAIWKPAPELLLGLFVFPCVSVYVFGVTAYLTGLSPNELLFDTPRFALYGCALAVLAVPLLVAALAWGTAPLVAGGTAIGVSLIAGLLGWVLARMAGPKWDRRLRMVES